MHAASIFKIYLLLNVISLSSIQCGRYQLTFFVTVSEQKFLQTGPTGEEIINQSACFWHKIKIGKVGNFSVGNENFRAEISDFLLFFAVPT